ncbi:MAG: VCBS repeat-containing protein [Candidatus Hydrogenedentes bacterium]|nr:VCBS repeat-containing protein [Candidatus Hydrogenedentota bacterium]
MISPILVLAILGADFVQQEFDGVIPYEPAPYGTPEKGKGFRLGDFNGDGASDVITKDFLLLQLGGGFPRQGQRPLPNFGGRAAGDLWGQDLYFLLSDRLEIVRWSGDTWQRVLSQDMSWPRTGLVSQLAGSPQDNSVSFASFLFDVDGQGTPEVILPAEDGVHIYRRNGAFYEAAGTLLASLPPFTLENAGDVTLWPQKRRALSPPRQTRTFSFSLREQQVCLAYASPVAGGMVQHRLCHYPVLPGKDGFSLGPEPALDTLSKPVPAGVSALFLNGDDVIDLCQTQVTSMTTSTVPVPVLDVSLSTNGGETFTTLRSVTLTTTPRFADMNGDGLLDFIGERTALFDGGLRETLLRAMSRRRVDHEVRVHLQSAARGFSASPLFSHLFAVDLDKAPLHQSPLFMRYTRGSLVNMQGDFDADGFLDAAIQDRPDRIAVYRGSQSGFETVPYAAITLTAIESFCVADLNADGRADVLADAPVPGAPDRPSRTSIFLMKGGAP